MFDKVATWVLALIVGLMVAGVFTIPVLWLFQGLDSVLAKWAACLLVFLAVMWSITLHVRPRDESYA